MISTLATLRSRETLGRIQPPQSWKNPDEHWMSVVQHPYYRELARVQDCLNHAIHSFFHSRGISALDLPLTTGSVSSPMGLGSDSLPVSVELCGQRTYMADSMQFLLEVGCRLSGSGVYYKSISFRGEDTDATHLQQFHHAECEIPGSFEDITQLGGQFIHWLTTSLLAGCPDSIVTLAGSLDHLVEVCKRNGVFPRISVHEAVRELGESGGEYVVRHPVGFPMLTRRGERALVASRGDGLAVWLTHFPRLATPFYQAEDPENPDVTLCGDLILGECEALGCGQRHLSDDSVSRALDAHSVPPESYQWYMDMRRISPVQTAGFGLGIERFLMWVLKQSDIRDCTLLPRERLSRCLP
jgi:asparaginyl-tRNA synthetase